MTSLRQRMTEDMQIRNLSPHTQASYVLQVSLFARHFGQSPTVLGPEEIRAYQVYLTNEKKLAPASITTMVSALRFLYKVTLKKDWAIEDVIPAPKKPQTAHCPQSGGGCAVPGSRQEAKASHHLDDVLRRGLTDLRSRAPGHSDDR